MWDNLIASYNPISWWKLNEASGLAVDYGSAGNNATNNSNLTRGQTGPIKGNPLETGTQYATNGQEYYAGANRSPYAFGTTNSFTTGFWFQFPSGNPTTGYWSAAGPASAAQWIFVYQASNSKFSNHVSDGTNNTFPGSSAALPNDQAWHFAVMVIDRGIQRATVYVDGVAGSPTNISSVGSLSATTNITVAAYSVSPDKPMTAAQVFILGQALTSAQIQTLYVSASVPGHSAGMLGIGS